MIIHIIRAKIDNLTVYGDEQVQNNYQSKRHYDQPCYLIYPQKCTKFDPVSECMYHSR
jgi:hypothetical protein